MLTLVMHDMRGPEHVHFMAEAVIPVVEKVVQHERQNPAGNAGPERVVAPQGNVLEHRHVNANSKQLGKDRNHLAEQAQTDGAERIGQAIGMLLPSHADRPFNGDHCEKNRRGDDDDLAG